MEGNEPPSTHLQGNLGNIPTGRVAVDVMSWKLLGGIAEHRFVRFTYAGPEGNPHVLDFHGLATNKETGVSKPVGMPWRDNIVIWPNVPTRNSDSQNNTEHLHRMGTFDIAQARRMMAAIAVGAREINDGNIPYRAVQTDPFLVDKNMRYIGDTTNSNAAARTILELAGLNPDVVRGGFAPGYSGRLLPPKDGDHGRMSIDGIRSTIKGFSNEDMKEGVRLSFDSLRGSIPDYKGDILKEGISHLDDIMRRTFHVEGLGKQMNHFLKGMDEVPELKTGRPSLSFTSGLN